LLLLLSRLCQLLRLPLWLLLRRLRSLVRIAAIDVQLRLLRLRRCSGSRRRLSACAAAHWKGQLLRGGVLRRVGAAARLLRAHLSANTAWGSKDACGRNRRRENLLRRRRA
jgi:hypothetical protein